MHLNSCIKVFLFPCAYMYMYIQGVQHKRPRWGEGSKTGTCPPPRKYKKSKKTKNQKSFSIYIYFVAVRKL